MNKNLYPKFTEAQIGDTLERPVLISSISENTAKNGKPFLKVTIKDGFSEQSALMFETSSSMFEAKGIKKGNVADVKLSVSEYQGTKSFKIIDISPCTDTSVSAADFIKLPPVDIQQMYDEICSLIESSADTLSNKFTPLSDLTLRLLKDNKQAYMTSSASVYMHHNMTGGLIYHSYRMVKTADAICKVYTNLDRELLICGAALHDIGKIWEYKTLSSGDAEFTIGGVLFGHLYMGASLIKSYCDRSYNMEKVQLLTHLILSHHGVQEWGAVSCPAIPEALALHFIDNLDAKMYICEEQYEALNPGELTDKKPYALDNKLYKPKYSTPAN